MRTITSILIDNSGSMSFNISSENQYPVLDLAKQLLIKEVIPTLDYSDLIKIDLFHGIKHSLRYAELYSGGYDIKKIESTINNIVEPSQDNDTPIAAAITTCVHKLAAFTDFDRKIILVTDGGETGNGNYRQAAREARLLHGVPCNIFVVGLNLGMNAGRDAENIATETGGAYVNLDGKLNFKEVLTQALAPLKSKLVENSIKKLQSFDARQIDDADFENNDAKQVKSPSEEKQSLDINISLANKLNEKLKFVVAQDSTLNDECDIEENKELNEEIRRVSEQYLYEHLSKKNGTSLKWLNQNGESGANHDFEIIDEYDGTVEYYIECKGSINTNMEFYLTKSEWELLLNNRKNYQLYYIYNTLTQPRLLKINNLWDWILAGDIMPYSFRNKMLKAERVIFTILKK